MPVFTPHDQPSVHSGEGGSEPSSSPIAGATPADPPPPPPPLSSQPEHIVLRFRYLIYAANIINHSQLGFLHKRMGILTADYYLYYGRVVGRMAADQHATFLRLMSDAWNATGGYARALRRYYFDRWDQSVCLCISPQVGAAPLDHGLPFCNKRGHYRWSINMFVIDAASIVKPAQQQDELFFSNYLPTVANDSRTAVVGRAVAVHGMYHSQRTTISEKREHELWLQKYEQLSTQYCSLPYPHDADKHGMAA